MAQCCAQGGWSLLAKVACSCWSGRCGVLAAKFFGEEAVTLIGIALFNQPP